MTGSKYALAKLGKMGSTVRSPLIDVEPSTGEKIDAALRAVGLMN